MEWAFIDNRYFLTDEIVKVYVLKPSNPLEASVIYLFPVWYE